MDDMVLQAMSKWPNVPDCYGWLGLDSRGHWCMRDDRVQLLGAFQSGLAGAKGSVLRHEKLIEFIHRNYEVNAQGCWYFQNGPQRVYVELEAAPYVWRLNEHFEPTAHSGQKTQALACLVDELGRVYLHTPLGLGLVHTWDVVSVAEAIAQGLWVPEECQAQNLAARFGFTLSPQNVQSEHHKAASPEA
jgi:Protein of unknown function (DUF2946)